MHINEVQSCVLLG